MAQVWAARHRGSGSVVALKMLLPHLAENVAFREMFVDEARIASRIRHENVARMFELVDLDGTLTLVMEWVDGGSMVRMLCPSLEERDDLPVVALPIRHAAKIVAETCAGLHAAHELVGDDGRPLAVVHRDVSPHNILLTRDGHVKVTDFGVAKAIGKSHMTIAGQVKGKLAYMSPEQLIGGGVDRRSDIFSLGSVLYESTTGQRPFQGDHDPQVMAAIVMGNFRPPSDVVRGYPRGLEEIVMKALSAEPDARFPTALHLKQALESWLSVSGPPIGAAQVAHVLQERCGAEFRARAIDLSNPHFAPSPQPVFQPPPSEPHPPASSSSAMEIERRKEHAPSAGPAGVSALSAILAALVGVALGLGVLVYVRSVRLERRAPVEDTSTTTATLSSATRDASAGALEDALATTADADVPSNEVTLHAPRGARIFVDGRELPAGTMSLPRLDAGVITVLVKAEGHEDAIVEIRSTSSDEIDVPMVPKPKAKPRTRARPRANAPPAMPPNPYD